MRRGCTLGAQKGGCILTLNICFVCCFYGVDSKEYLCSINYCQPRFQLEIVVFSKFFFIFLFFYNSGVLHQFYKTKLYIVRQVLVQVVPVLTYNNQLHKYVFKPTLHHNKVYIQKPRDKNNIQPLSNTNIRNYL